jgi:succinate dehydrogenase/fumarate reductase cytochrome b subunit
MTTQAVEAPPVSDAASEASPWQRRLALSGVVFAPLFVVGWLASAVSDSPNYIAAEQKWITWAQNDHIKGRVSSFALVLAAFAFIYFLGALRTVLEEAEAAVRGSRELARVAFAGALTGIAGITMAFVSIANASAPGAHADPLVSKAVSTSAAGPFLVGATGFSAFLLATGVLTLRAGVLSRWTGFVALVGAGCFFITLLTILNNSGDGSAFGYAFFPAMLSLVVWTVATSVARFRALAA